VNFSTAFCNILQCLLTCSSSLLDKGHRALCLALSGR